jgi:hypothetical protein
MKINGFTVTSNIWVEEINYVDHVSCHIELDGCLRLVQLKDTEYATLAELQTAIEALTFPSK